MTKLGSKFQVWTCETYNEPSLNSDTLTRLWQFQECAAQGEDFLAAYVEVPVNPRKSLLFN